MARYSTSLEVIVNNLCENREASTFDRIESARPKIFNFSYPTTKLMPVNEFKKQFETGFLTHFLFHELGFETVERFKVLLYSRCLEVMPTYVVKLDALYSFNTENLYKNINTQRDLSDKTDTDTQTDSNSQSNASAKSRLKGKNIGADLPENLIQFDKIPKEGYASNANLSESNGTNKSESDTNTNTKGKINQDKTVKETYKGNTENIAKIFTDANEIKNTWTELFNEFNDLFMSIYY